MEAVGCGREGGRIREVGWGVLKLRVVQQPPHLSLLNNGIRLQKKDETTRHDNGERATRALRRGKHGNRMHPRPAAHTPRTGGRSKRRDRPGVVRRHMKRAAAEAAGRGELGVGCWGCCWSLCTAECAGGKFFASLCFAHGQNKSK